MQDIKLSENFYNRRKYLWPKLSKKFLDLTKAWSINKKMSKLLDFIKINFFYLQKSLLRGWKDKLQTRRKYLQITYSTKICMYPGHIKSSLNSTRRKQTIPLEYEQKTCSLHPSIYRQQRSTWKYVQYHWALQKCKLML